MEISSQIQNLFTTLMALLLGACMGSFINASAMRTAAGKKWWGTERSKCDHCAAELKSRDLVPIFSYILLGGKCRYCGGRIAPRHFYAEAVCAMLTAALYLRWDIGSQLAVSLAVLWFSLFNSLTDLEDGYIYDFWALALGVVGMGMRVFGGTGALIEGVLGGALGFCVIAAFIMLSRGGMGWGDATLMLGIGAAVGWKYCAMSLYLGFLCGGLVVIPLMMAKKLKRKDAVPLGPFLAAGAVVTLFVGDAFLRRISTLIGSFPGWPWGF